MMKKKMIVVMAAMIVLALSGHAQASSITATLSSFTGGDIGEGCDFSGTFKYAVDLRGSGGQTVQDAVFATDSVSGVTVTATGNATPFGVPSMGSSTNDTNLYSVLSSVRYGSTSAPLLIDLNVDAGYTYKLQLLLADNTFTRAATVSIEGTQVLSGASIDKTHGWVVTSTFMAPDSVLNISGGAYDGSTRLMNGFTLELLGVPHQWNNLSSGDWGTLGNWSATPSSVPTWADDVHVSNGGTANVSSGSRAAYALSITSGGVNVNGGSLAVTTDMTVGASGSLHVYSGSTLSAATLSSSAAGTSFDAGSTVTIPTVSVTAGSTNIGAGTITTLTASGGMTGITGGSVGTVTASGSQATVTVSGGSVGTVNGTSGTVNLSSGVTALNVTGATVDVTADGDVSVGSVTVTGGTVNTGSHSLVVSNKLTLGTNVTCQISGSGTPTFKVSSANLLSDSTARTLTLQGGTLGISRAADPALTSGLELWLNAGAITGLSDGATVTQWNDISGHSHNATANAGTPKYYSSGLNGQPVVRFDNASSFSLGNLSSYFLNAARVFVVSTISSDDTYTIFDTNNSDDWWRHGQTNQSYPDVFRSSRINSYYSQMPTTGSHIFEIQSTSSTWQMWLDSGVTGGAKAGAYSAGSNFQIGNGGSLSNSNRWLNGDIAEILVFNRDLTSAEVNYVGGYLKAKYGITASGYSLSSTLGWGNTALSVTDETTLNLSGWTTVGLGDLSYDMALLGTSTSALDITSTGVNDITFGGLYVSGTPAGPGLYTLLSWSTSSGDIYDGMFDNTHVTLGGGYTGTLSYTGTQVNLNVVGSSSPIPEPAALGFVGLVLLAVRRRSRLAMRRRRG